MNSKITTKYQIVNTSPEDLPFIYGMFEEAIAYIKRKGFIGWNSYDKKFLQLDIEKDFLEIYIIDPIQSKLTKKDIFLKLLIDYRLKVHEVLVIGDDLDSEIKAANDMRIDTILYDRESEHTGIENQMTINSFKDLHLANWH